MVGIPKSNRCTFCKARKTKCDENWPTCGACARAGKVCSGARNSFKFVVNGSHNELPDSPAEDGSDSSSIVGASDRGSVRTRQRRRCSPSGVMLNMKEYSKGGCGFHKMKLGPAYARLNHSNTSINVSPSPSPPPLMSPGDRLAAKLVNCLDAAPRTGNDLQILGRSLRMLPQQLTGDSVALQNAVELVVQSWTNSRRELPPSMWLDLRAYNRALRSLGSALEETTQSMVVSTVAAQTLLQKVEILYDFGRGANQENHAAGLTAVISRGGPYQHFSELGLHLTFENFFNMLQEDIRLGRESVFMSNDWTAALKQAIDTSTIRPVLKRMYRLWVEMTVWPTLVTLVRSLSWDPSDTMVAAELVLRAMPLLEILEHEDAITLTALIESGDIVEVESTLCPDLFPTCYEFRDYDTAKLFVFHAMFGILVCRTLQQANQTLNHDVLSLASRCRELSQRIWKSNSWMSTQRPLAVEFTAALCFSYESANFEEREFCLASLEVMEAYRRPPPIGKWLEATTMANVRGYTGRLPFIKTRDINVELCGLGCRH